MVYEVYNTLTGNIITQPVDLRTAYTILRWANRNLRGVYQSRPVTTI